MSLVDIRDLTVTYDARRAAVPAVRGVTLSVQAGASLGIAGESGCGKSSVALAMLRLLPATAAVGGHILLDGDDIATMSFGKLRAVRWSRASIVFQGAMHALNPVRAIGGQIAEPIRVHDPATTRADALTRARELLRQVGLPAWRADSYPHELSGGQRQRVMVAMALACRPRLIIADEATTALDVMIQAQVLDLVSDVIARQGIALIMISHDLSILASTCDELAVMYAGRVVEHGPTAKVVAHGAHPYTRGLARAFPTVGDPASRGRPRGVPGDAPSPLRLPDGCAFRPRCPIAIDDCAHGDIPLQAVAEGRRAACLRAGEETP
ncbi:MAG TPA: ABC transporter ATP-binding protein [Stackebrandtia sp.]|jgi:peptide/nickel transport system ATP-binding protein|uniref:ABC transporter ATP-binding protein n=1 Tax=Stackebrandtia sp. TaxID=2023065 RepID=UPI002D678A71|nr:ABC transporter ATP-binding protein [Stackebrandtia sp.]HZE38400.1 ABC transporter ATP-binding protein [Stackebrandtia sp.]